MIGFALNQHTADDIAGQHFAMSLHVVNFFRDLPYPLLLESDLYNGVVAIGVSWLKVHLTVC